MTKRASGVLLHPTALPNPYGIGDLGEGAEIFLDWLQSAGQSVWQILPLGPVGQGSSPYDASSSRAGDPRLIDLEALAHVGLLDSPDLDPAACPFQPRIDAESVASWKMGLLRRAYRRLMEGGAAPDLLARIRDWAGNADQAGWLSEWTLYAALKIRYRGRSWTDWPESLSRREDLALEEARRDLADEIDFQEFVQFLFFDQWQRLRSRAQEKGISLFGDLPFYVALDSCDVWIDPELFDLHADGTPRRVAGVPPDYFSATGQRWGNPLYRWDRMAEQRFGWWIERLATQLRMVDRLRLDHFRAFAGYWEIPAEESTAVAGRWREGPGWSLFQVVREELGRLPFVAEDLGLITPDVEELRIRLEIPGMRVLQFGFDSADSPHLPHNLPPDVVLYTGTHDNHTARGWIEVADPGLRQRALDYLGGTVETFHWDLLRAAQTSVAELVVTPVQDIVGLDDRHRMNTPGTTTGNWIWRLQPETLSDQLAARLRRMSELAGRVPSSIESSPPPAP